MNQNYAKALTFDCDTFSEIKNNLNFVLQRLISNMVGTGANDGQLTLKLDVSFCKNTIENYDAEIDAPSPILPSAVCSMMIWPMPVSAMLPLKLCLNTLMTTSTRTASKFSLH